MSICRRLQAHLRAIVLDDTIAGLAYWNWCVAFMSRQSDRLIYASRTVDLTAAPAITLNWLSCDQYFVANVLLLIFITFLLNWSNGVVQLQAAAVRKLFQSTATEFKSFATLSQASSGEPEMKSIYHSTNLRTTVTKMNLPSFAIGCELCLDVSVSFNGWSSSAQDSSLIFLSYSNRLSLASSLRSVFFNRDAVCIRLADFVIKFLKFTMRLVRCCTWSSNEFVWSWLANSKSFIDSRGWTPLSKRPYMPRQNLMLCGAKFGKMIAFISGLYNGLTYSFMWFAINPHNENVNSPNFKSSRSFSQLPINVPNWHDCTWSCRMSKKRSLNSNASLRCCINWNVQSRNCVKTGDISFGSVWMYPHRSLNLWPNASQSFSMSAWKPLIVR